MPGSLVTRNSSISIFGVAPLVKLEHPEKRKRAVNKVRILANIVFSSSFNQRGVARSIAFSGNGNVLNGY
jgi:hypothetical protein